MDFINDSDHFDQHFLIDDEIINKFITEAHFNLNDIVVEVGPGKGILTSIIAKKVKKLYCIELDNRLKKYLDVICSKNKNVTVIYSSVLDVTIPLCNKIITSLPYSIVEPFMNKMIKTSFDELFMITGKKYADGVSNNEITYLSLLTNCFFDFEKVIDIEPQSFNPKPHAMSSMVKLKYKNPDATDIYAFFRNMYLLNHKKIKNGIIESLISTGFSKTQRSAKEILTSMNLDDSILETKFEVCSNEQLLLLYERLNLLYNDKN